jgi:uncharacterized membrane protein
VAIAFSGDNVMNRIFFQTSLCIALLALAGCGNSTGDRALSGAGIGAGVGALGGLIVGAPVQGAVIGGAVGAGTGALTKKEQIDLGKPVWR